jgi:hypothetical protein
MRLTHFAQAEPVAFAQLQRPARAIQIEYRFACRSLDVNMCGAMIVWIHDHTQSIEPINGWHRPFLAKTQALGNGFVKDT